MAGEQSEQGTQPLRRGIGDSMYTREAYATREAPWRANKGAPGVDRQDFTEVEAYGVKRPGRGQGGGGVLQRGHGAVVDADLSDYFGSIPMPQVHSSLANC
jgi:hypothetical protein